MWIQRRSWPISSPIWAAGRLAYQLHKATLFVVRGALDLVGQILPPGPPRGQLDRVLLLPFGPGHRAFGRVDDGIVDAHSRVFLAVAINYSNLRLYRPR